MAWPPAPQVTPLPRQGTLTVVVDPRHGLTLTVADRRGERAETTIEYPTGGYGGHEVVLGPRRLMALFLYSGQSQVGYELFELETLRHLGRLPYQKGEGDAPVFSRDGRRLAMAWDAGDLRYAEDLDDDERPRPGSPDVVPWARLALQSVASRRVVVRTIHADLRGWRPSEDRVCQLYPEALRFAGARELRVRAPWGREVAIPLPLPKRIVVEGP